MNEVVLVYLLNGIFGQVLDVNIEGQQYLCMLDFEKVYDVQINYDDIVYPCINQTALLNLDNSEIQIAEKE